VPSASAAFAATWKTTVSRDAGAIHSTDQRAVPAVDTAAPGSCWLTYWTSLCRSTRIRSDSPAAGTSVPACLPPSLKRAVNWKPASFMPGRESLMAIAYRPPAAKPLGTPSTTRRPPGVLTSA
jgi:hypothetical protein